MSKDPLDGFRALMGGAEIPENYPGNVPPKNRPAPPPKGRKIDAGDPDGSPTWDSKPCYYRVNGELREFFRIGDLAQACGVKPVTVRGWEDRLGFPKPKTRTARPAGPQARGQLVGQRLYTRAQVEMVAAAYQQFRCADRTRSDFKGFVHHVHSQWRVY